MTSGDHDLPNDTFAYHLASGTWPPADAYVASLEFDANDGAGAASRRALEAHLLERVLDDELELLKTLVSELVTNAVVHDGRRAEARIGLLVGASQRCLRVEVRDNGPGFEGSRTPSPHHDGGGFGLLLVDRIASRWGVASEDGSCVWFELDR
jgi:anti-sigma regulatory factor (Ser/Thr protein kinase)